MGPLYTPKDLLRVWNELIDTQLSSGILTQPMSKEFVKATRDALAEKVGCITISEKEQKRVEDLIKKLEHKVSHLKNELKCAQQANAKLREEMEKANPQKPIWWHWIMDQCRNEKCSFYGSNVSQGPVHDDIGEDINLFEKVNEYNERQRNGETNYCCDGCGQKLKMMHRHAIADWNVIVDDNDDPIRKEPLTAVQKANEESGKFLTEAEYARICNPVELKNAVVTK